MLSSWPPWRRGRLSSSHWAHSHTLCLQLCCSRPHGPPWLRAGQGVARRCREQDRVHRRPAALTCAALPSIPTSLTCPSRMGSQTVSAGQQGAAQTPEGGVSIALGRPPAGGHPPAQVQPGVWGAQNSPADPTASTAAPHVPPASTLSLAAGPRPRLPPSLLEPPHQAGSGALGLADRLPLRPQPHGDRVWDHMSTLCVR